MGIRIWAGQQPFANAGPGPTRLLENESCEWALAARLARCPRPPEGPLTEPTAGAQPWPRERVLMPLCRHSPRAPRLAHAGGNT
jgi:hypothetical protein